MPSAELKAIFSGDTSGLKAATREAEAELARLKKAGGGDLIGDLKGGESWAMGLRQMSGTGKIKREWAELGTELDGMREKSAALAKEWPTLREQIGNTSPAVYEASAATRKFASDLNNIKSSFMGLKGEAAAALKTYLGFAGIRMGVQFFRGALEMADNIKEAAQRTGMSITAFQRLNYAARQTGTSMEGVETAFRRLQAVIGGGEMTSKQEAAFNRLGLSVAYLKTLSPDALFQAVGTAVAAIPDATQRASMAVMLFGNSGTAILPMVADMKNLGDNAERLGLILSEQTVKQAAEFNDKLDELKLRAQAGSLSIVDLSKESMIATGLMATLGAVLGGPFGAIVGGAVGTAIFKTQNENTKAELADEAAAYAIGPGADTARLRKARELRDAAKVKDAADKAKQQEGEAARLREQDYIARANAIRDAKFSAASISTNTAPSKADTQMDKLIASAEYWKKAFELLQQRLPGGS